MNWLPWGLIVAVLVIIVSFYPVAHRRYKNEKAKEKQEELFLTLQRTLHDHGLELDKSKKYHYDFHTNVLTIKP